MHFSTVITTIFPFLMMATLVPAVSQHWGQPHNRTLTLSRMSMLTGSMFLCDIAAVAHANYI
jgi:hypothetical protein